MSKFALHMMKFNKGQMYGLDVHIERKTQNHSNREIDPARSHLNYELKPEYQNTSYTKAVNRRLAEGYLGVKALRKDAVVACSFIVSSDSDFFAKLTPEQEKAYFQTAYDYIAQKYGEKNIISAKVHKDETTPHMHLVLVPLTQDGRLSAKELFDRQALLDLQAEIPKRLKAQGFKIERGTSSSKKHLTTAEYKKMKIESQVPNEKINPQDLVPKTLSKRFLLKDVENIEQVADRLSKAYLEPKNAQISELRSEIKNLKSQTVKKSKFDEISAEIASVLYRYGFNHSINVIEQFKKFAKEQTEQKAKALELQRIEKEKIDKQSAVQRLADKLKVGLEKLAKILDFGKAPHQFEDNGKPSYYVITENAKSEKIQVNWGFEYQDFIENEKLNKGDYVIVDEGKIQRVAKIENQQKIGVINAGIEF